jgi:hypothetical protein
MSYTTWILPHPGSPWEPRYTLHNVSEAEAVTAGMMWHADLLARGGASERLSRVATLAMDKVPQ